MSTKALPSAATSTILYNDIKSGYYAQLREIQSSISFEDAVGRNSPYTKTPIETRADYDLYCHSYAICRLYDRDRSAIEENAARRVERIEKAHIENDIARSQQMNRAMFHLKCKSNFYIFLIILGTLLLILFLALNVFNFSSKENTSSNSSEKSTPAASSYSPLSSAKNSSTPSGNSSSKSSASSSSNPQASTPKSTASADEPSHPSQNNSNSEDATSTGTNSPAIEKAYEEGFSDGYHVGYADGSGSSNTGIISEDEFVSGIEALREAQSKRHSN